MSKSFFRSPSMALLLATAALAASAEAAPATGDNAARARYLQEKAACTDGRSHQERSTCLKEAGNAYDEARRRPVAPADAGTLERNAVARCQNVLPKDRPECERLALGQGKASGSVEGGGVIKEIRTVEPAPTPR